MQGEERSRKALDDLSVALSDGRKNKMGKKIKGLKEKEKINSGGYRATAMSERREPRSKHMHDPALEKYKKARQEMHPRFESTSRRSTRAASSAAPQYAEGSGSSSSDTDTDEFRVEPRKDRKRKSIDRGSEGDNSDEEQEIEEESVHPFQHQPGQGVYEIMEFQHDWNTEVVA
ncbi:uncharacterized protein [Miscanthus floridulus]|uniref:uncharacterized protein n=1 Tax=Miscanthus floridulus TaxID=154761 RepID=UPI00345B0C5C